MKPFLPHNVLVVLTAVFVGAMVLYNTVIREDLAATLRYAYPAVEAREESRPDPERILPQPQGEEEPDAAPALTSVRFPLELNAATVEELKFIPQVGDVMAERIIQFRDHIGGYSDLEQLRNIKGVGEKTYQHLYAYLYLVEEGAQPLEEPGEAGEPSDQGGEEDGGEDEAPWEPQDEEWEDD